MNPNPSNPTPTPSIPWLRKARWVCVSLAFSILAACGGGGGAEAITPAVSQPVSSGELSSVAIPVAVEVAKSITPIYDSNEKVESLNINDSALASQIKAGSILVMPATEDTPQGIALKIKTVTPTAAGVNVTFTQPGINEVFKNLEIRISQNINAGDIVGASLPVGVKMITQAYPANQAGVAFPSKLDGLALVYEPKAGLPKTINTGDWFDAVTGDPFQRYGNYQLGEKIGFKLDKLVLIDFDGKATVNDGKQARDFNTGKFISLKDATTNDQIRLSGEVSIKNSAVDFDIKIQNHEVMRMGARMNGTIDSKLMFGYEYAGSASLTDKYKKLENGYKLGKYFEINGIDFGDERIYLGSVGIALDAKVFNLTKGNEIPLLPLGALVSFSVGLKGDITANATLGFNYTAYFDQGLYVGKKSVSEPLAVLDKISIFAHGDYPNPNVTGARVATKEEENRKPFFSYGVDGTASVVATDQFGIDLSIVIGGIIPVQVSSPLVQESKMLVKGSAWRREAGWDITGCYQISTKIDLKSNLYTRIAGKIDSNWDVLDANVNLIDKKFEIISKELLPEKGMSLTCSSSLNPEMTFEISPKDLPVPAFGKAVVRFAGDAKWITSLIGSKSGTAEIDKWEWKFGESAVKDAVNASLNRKDDQYPIYTYDGPGSYDVELKVTDRYGQEATVKKTVVIKAVTINATPTNPTVLQTVSFWLTEAYDTVKSVVWSFGADIADKTAAVANSISTTVTQAFSTTGAKPITATLMDATNKVLGTLATTVNVSALPMPTATITGATSDTATQPGAIANNGTTDDTTPTLKGTLSAALTGTQHVNIYDGSTQFAAYATASGTSWTFTPAAPLAGGGHRFTAEVGDGMGNTGARSTAYVINILAPGITSATPAEAMRTVPTTFTVVGRDLPTSGITVTMPDDTDSRAKCNAPTGMTATGFTVVCTLYKFDEATDAQRKLVISAGAKQLGSHTVNIKSNITDVNWAAPSTGNVYGKGTVQFKEDITFKATGTNLLADTGMGFAVELCGVANKEVGTPTNTQRTFTCMFNNEAGAVAGQMPLVFKDKQGGGGLFRVNVPVVVAPSVANSMVMSWDYPSLGTIDPVPNAGPVTVPINDAVNYEGFMSGPVMDVKLSANKVRLFNFRSYDAAPGSAAFSSGTFNGLVLRVPSGANWQFTSASVGSANTLSGLTNARVTTQGGANGWLAINVESLIMNVNTVIEVAYQTSSTGISTTGKLPDTGTTAAQCYAAGSDALVSCTSAAAIALNPKQDGMVGRDVTSPSNTDGKLGFSYSAVGSYSKEECVKDNITGLTWEGKPTTGLRAAGNTYTNYGDNSASDASTYVAAVNAAKLCGYSDWRLPTADELQGLVDYSVAYPGPTIDATWFPNTPQGAYWASTGYAGGSPWGVYFFIGDVYINDNRYLINHVRLVR